MRSRLASDVAAAVRDRPRSALVALDVDGTLAPIVARPEDARLVEGARETLQRLASRLGTVALISGRAALDVVRLGDLEAVPGLRVLGHYGLQSWYDGHLDSPPPVPGVDLVRRRLPELLRDAADGVSVEDKEHSLVVHTRPAADPAGALAELTPRLNALAQEAALEAVPGKLVLELRPPGVDKGSALRRLVDDTGSTAVVYAGDDLGDLPALDLIPVLRKQGLAALAVVSDDGDAAAELRDRADLVVPGPAAVVEWLRTLL